MTPPGGRDRDVTDTSPSVPTGVRMSTARLIAGVVVGSSAALVPFVIGAAVAGVFLGYPVVARGFGHGVALVVLFGWPISVLATACVGIPGYFILQRQERARLRFAWGLIVGAVCGSLVMPIAWWTVWGSIDTIPIWVATGACMGAAGALGFLLVVK